MFKTNPKQLVERVARNLYGLSAKVKVSGHRPTPLECKAENVKPGHYVTTITVDGKHIAQATDRNWRYAYVQLRVNLEKEFEKSLTDAKSV